MTAWHRNEYILKGLFLGLWLFFALQVPDTSAAAWRDIAWVLGWTCFGLFVGLVIGTAKLSARGVKPWDNWKAFPFVLVLESSLFIYAGLLLGLIVGVVSGREFAQPWSVPIANAVGLTWDDIKHVPPVGNWLGYCAIGGALLGFGMYRMRQMEDRQYRFWGGMLIAAAMVYLASNYLDLIKVDVMVPDPTDPGKLIEKQIPDPADASKTITEQVAFFASAERRFHLGVYLLLGLVFFYLLTFCGDADESEAELMTFCAVLGIALYLIGFASGFGISAPFLIPLALYYVYGTRVMPGLRSYKYVLRGFSYMNAGRLAPALRLFRRAQDLSPDSELANAGMLQLHNNLTLSKLEGDPDLIEALDFGLCLDRAAALLMIPPTQQARDEAEKFLALVEKNKPVYSARIDYLHAISFIHAKQYDAAAATLSRFLDPETPGYHTGLRKQVYFDALSLALDGPKSLTDRLGWNELNKPGRRIEAIAAVERKLGADASHEKAKEYRTMLYSQLTEREFVSAIADDKPPKDFNYDYVEQLGQQLVDDNDPDRRERGAGYLRIAVRGLPERGPGIFKRLADVSAKLGNHQDVHGYTERIRAVGLHVGPSNLAKDQRDIYLKALQGLAKMAEDEGDAFKADADAADAQGDAAARAAKDAEAKPYYETAIAYHREYLDGGGGAALEAYRKIADLFGKMRDALNAVLNTEAALAYNSGDPDLARKRDSFYYSVTIERLTEAKDRVGKWFDVGYCVRKAMWVLNAKDADAELLDWATHLVRLAKVIEPTSNRVRLVEARCLLRRGERDAGLSLLEDVREGPKGSGDEEEAWYNTTRLLGQLYLEELNRPDLALKAYSDYKDYHKSGADTLFNIARCYEALGDPANAAKFYHAVTAFEEHPKYWDAKDALRRLGKE
jgi:tetratricopeptide (TPR) repeat protein